MGEKALEILLFTLGGVYHGLTRDWNVLELAILAGIAIAIRRACLPRMQILDGVEAAFARFSHRRAATCLAAGAMAVALRAALIPVLPAPTPVVSDEFSHLLLADTLLHGRVSNPTPPLWPHFESLQILVHPRYVSNYFPGQGAVLAAARLLAGSPWAGILALSGLFAAALCWALQGWMPRRWALLGTSLGVLRLSVGSYWINAFHGGFLPALGGALVAGSFARLHRRASVSQSLVLGCGLAILAWSRPYEGLLFALPLLATLAFRRGRVLALAPGLTLAAAALIPLGLYFCNITGSPFVTPYSVSQKQYGWPMTFAWARPSVIHHTNPELRFYYEYELAEHAKVSGPREFVEYLTFRLQEYWRFFYGPALSVALLWSGWVFRSRRYLALLAGAGGALFAVMLEGAASPHYLAPATMPLVALLTLSIWRMRRSYARGIALSRALVIVMTAVLAGRIAAGAIGLPYTQSINYQSWCCKAEGRLDKARFASEIGRHPGLHLVFVRAKRDPYNFFQWIYNDADIDRSKIVWARDLGAERNRRLTAHFRGRTVWSVDPNSTPATLRRGPPD